MTIGLFNKQIVRSVFCAMLALIVGCQSGQDWQLHEVTHHLPDLHFSLLSQDEHTITERDFQDHVVLLFFGFTHCQSECPLTLHRLADVVGGLGTDAEQVRILFVSLDPSRDNPQVLQRYVASFAAQHIFGLTGKMTEIEDMARRYRIAYRANDLVPATITHSTAVYVFDQRGRARLLITPTDSDKAIIEDLHQLLRTSK